MTRQNLDDLLSEYKNNPEFQKEYKELQPYYQAAKLVIELRTQHNMTQKQLAEKAHTSQSAINRLESGLQSPSLKTLNKIFNVFGRTLHLSIQ